MNIITGVHINSYRPNPFQVSVYPGAGCTRICTTARFLSQTSSKPLTIINTHLDHLSDEQRKYGASLLLIRGRYEAATSKGPVLLTGDFNSPPTGRNSGAYGVTTGKTTPLPVDKRFKEKYHTGKDHFPDFRFLDTRAETPRFGVSENFATFTGWSPSATEEWERIDFVFGGSCRRWYVHLPDRGYTWERGVFGLTLANDGSCLCVCQPYRASTACKIGAGMSDDGMMHSDHRPVFVDLNI